MGKNSGFAFHVHDTVSLEFCFDYKARVRYIKKKKPWEEQKLRLRLFKLIPNDKVPQPLLQAEKAYREANKALIKAENAHREENKAYKVYLEVAKAYQIACSVYIPDLIKLHEELCPDCPWNGETIFTRKNGGGEWY